MAKAASQAKRNNTGAPAPLALYRTVLLIRRFEECIRDLCAQGKVPSFIHLSIGQEAVAAGVMSALGPDDTVTSTHRAHGHAIAKGVPPDRVFAELFAREQGICRGRGGSMHLADFSRGFLGANGIVAAGLPIAAGSALAHRALGRKAIAVAFFGDGALGEGLVHESFNLARLWRLPVLFVCENNGWGEFSPTSAQLAFRLADLAAAYGLPHRAVDGNDVEAVAAAAHEAVDRVRSDEGPALLECAVQRMRGHYEGDPQRYRDPAEIAGLAARDCVAVAASRLPKAEAGRIAREVDEAVAKALDAALAGSEPVFDDASNAVYARPIA